MAYIVQAVQSYTDTVFAASFAVDNWITDTQLDNDRILFVAVNDGGGSAISISSGWTEIYKSAATIAGVRVGIWEAKRSGSDITAPTLTGASDDWNCCAVLIRDADPTTFLDVAVGITEQTASVTKYVAPSVTTTNNDALVIRIAGLDLNGISTPAAVIGGFIDVSRRLENNGAELYIVEQTKRTAGATGTFTWDRGASDGGVLATLAIRNKSGGAVAPHSDQAFTVVEEFTESSVDTPAVASIHTRQATVCGVSTLTPTSGPTVITVQNYSADQNWYGPFIQVSTQPPVTAGVYGGVFPVTADWSAGKLFALLANTAQNNVMSKDGPVFYFEDNSGNWRTWRPVNRFYFGNNNFKALIADLPNETFVDSVGSIDWANIVYFGMVHENTTANGTARTVQLRALGSIDVLKVAGGGSTRPVTFADVTKIVSSGSGIYRGYLQGAGQALVGIPLQIGNGTDSTYFVGAAQSLEYQISGVVNTPWFRLGELDQPLTIYASAADTINFDSAIIATTTRQALTIHASSSTSAAYSFLGASIVGWDVTWKTGINCTSAAFSRCGEIDAKGAQFNNCTISGTRSTDAAIAFDANSSMSGTTIDVTGTSAAYHLELGTAVTAFTLTNVTFTGTPGTDKVHVKATTGTVTITLSGSTALAAGDVTSDGATVTILSGADVELTGLVAGSEVRAFVGTPDSATLLASTESSGTTFTFNQSQAGNAGFIVVRKLDYKFLKISLTYSGSNQSIPVQQQLDRDYLNP